MRTVNSPNHTGRSLRNHSRRNDKSYSSLKSTVCPRRGRPFGSYRKPSSYGGEPIPAPLCGMIFGLIEAKPRGDILGFFFLKHKTRETQNKTLPLSYDSDVGQVELFHTQTKRTHHEPLHPPKPAPEHARRRSRSSPLRPCQHRQTDRTLCPEPKPAPAKSRQLAR